MNPLDPQSNAVIEACAGSGKTWMLVSRIVRLLLAGAQFPEILAITFTRKAAREMQNRLREWLALLALGSDAEVRQFLRDRALPDEEMEACLPKARMLFEASLRKKTNITTFHGWFLELLRCAPLSSNLAGARLVESVSAMVEEAWQRFAEGLQKDPENPAAIHLKVLFADHGIHNTRKILTGFLEKRAEWWAYTRGRQAPVDFALEKLREELDVDPDEDVLEAFHSDTEGFDALWEYARLLGQNTESDKIAAADLEQAISPQPRFEAIWSIFFTDKGMLRIRKESASQEKRLGFAGQARFLDLHGTIGGKLAAIREKIINRRIYRYNESGLIAGDALLRYYQNLKEELGAIDFTDVEWRAFELLNHSEHAEYMQYKLDSRYHHILLDEFQDTNPFQWQILKSWLAASNDAGLRPTVFMVGDPKQSIYRFRRAEARLFDIAADFFEKEYGARRMMQNLSRRSSPVVIDCVNRVFETVPDFPRHEAHRQDLHGMVEVLPLEEEAAVSAEERMELRNPLESPRREADLKLEAEARQFASRVDEIVGSYPVKNPDGSVRPARFGDIMVLSRKRSGLRVFEKALREAGIPYIGSSRGGLLETLEASDITALLSFMIAPFADLHLAQVLRSPIFGCVDADLMALASMPGGSWWQRLGEFDADSRPGAAYRMLDGWMDQAGRLPVHDLLDRIYFEGDVLRRYRDAVPEAMKASVCANLLAYIELALEVDSGRYPSLPKFMAELAELRRSSDDAPDEGIMGDAEDALRFYTIHGAKGLEAPIVWLLGANPASGARDENYGVILDWPPTDGRPAHFSLYSVKGERGSARSVHFEAEALHAQREDANLLYVAMTRAAQALFVSGTPSRAVRSWYHRILGAAGDSKGYVPAEKRAQENLPDADYSSFGTGIPIGSRESVTAEMRYGTLLHDALDRGGSIARHLPEEQALLDDIGCILDSPGLKRFFDPDLYVCARNEVSYATEQGEIRRMDRLVEFKEEVWILDYKTGDMKVSYRAQLEEYRIAMRSIFAKPVRCALIFRDGTLLEV
ncbi:MAG: UvrD-helicase domain-containing protein [Burkholderiales bacterium]|nr:UvrD-helicase domain-containing protein [Burkholderiales bacterium]